MKQNSLKRNCTTFTTGGIAFPTRGSQQEWNLIFFCSLFGPSPTRRGKSCPSSLRCQTMSGTRWSNSSIPYHHWWVFSWTFLKHFVNIWYSKWKFYSLQLCALADSQVAEIGGTLGLFVGFSFLGFFDAVVNISCSVIIFFVKGPLWSGNKSI